MPTLVAAETRDPPLSNSVLSGDGAASQSLLERGGGHQRADIQGMRAIAVLLVVAYHANLPISGGYVGVDVFFVISGYVITRMLTREWDTSQRIGLGKFYMRRAARLLPSLGLVLATTAIASRFLESPLSGQQSTATGIRSSSLFSANFHFLWHSRGYFAKTESIPVLHIWSLSVEEQFYFVFPLLILCTLWISHRISAKWARGITLVLLTLVAACSFLSSVILSKGLAARAGFYVPNGTSLAFFSSPTRAWEFLVGALLSGYLIRPGKAWVVRTSGWVGVGLLVAGAFFLDRDTNFPGIAVLLPVLGAACLIAYDQGARKTLVGRFLASRPMVAVGDLSYGWYLWHWPAIVLTPRIWHSSHTPLLAAIASLGMAVLTRRLVEVPFRRIRNRPILVVFVAGICILGPLALSSWLLHGANNLWGSRRLIVATSAENNRSLTDVSRHCIVPSDAIFPEASCRFPPRGPSKGRLVLLGDSHAGAVRESVVAAGNAAGLTVEVRAINGCPFNEVSKWTPTIFAIDSCATSRSTTWASFEKDPPNVVIIVNRTSGSLEREDLADGTLSNCVGSEPKTQSPCLSKDETYRAWKRGLEITYGRFAAMHTKVFVVETMPEHRRNTEDCIHGGSIDAGCLLTPRSMSMSLRSRSVALETSVARRYNNVRILDFFDRLCPSDPCNQELNGSLLYGDNDHLNLFGATLIEPELQQALESAFPR